MIGIVRLGIAGLTALFLPLWANAAPVKSCTNQSWEGNYGYLLTGDRLIAPNPGPRAAVGRISADGNGNLAGTETKNENGTIITGLSFNGSYSMLTDCTGTGVLTLSNGEVRNFNFVVVEDGERVLFIQTDGGRVITFTATKQQAR